MKIRLLFLSLLCFCVTQVQGQDDQCAAKIAEVESLVAANKFDDAFNAWELARKCTSESLYKNGEKILIHQLATPLSDADRTEQSAMLLQLYTDYDRDFPANTNSNAVKKAMFLYKKDKTQPEIFQLLDRAFAKDRSNFTDANALQIYFGEYFNRFSSGDKSITEENLIEKTDAVVAHLEKLFADTANKDYRLVAESIGRMTLPVITCDKRDDYYEKQFASKSSDVAWLASVTEGLLVNCQRSAFFYKAASAWYGLQPNARSAFLLGQASLQQRKSADALKYFAIAGELESNPLRKAEIYYAMAVREINNGPRAIELLRESLKAKQDFGKAYLLLAEVYASTQCGATPIEQKARYTLAAKTALKAAEADKALKATAESQASNYQKKAPSAAEIKDAKMSGKTVTFGCGINESVTL